MHVRKAAEELLQRSHFDQELLPSDEDSENDPDMGMLSSTNQDDTNSSDSSDDDYAAR